MVTRDSIIVMRNFIVDANRGTENDNIGCHWYSKYRFDTSRFRDTERSGRVALSSSPKYILFNESIDLA